MSLLGVGLVKIGGVYDEKELFWSKIKGALAAEGWNEESEHLLKRLCSVVTFKGVESSLLISSLTLIIGSIFGGNILTIVFNILCGYGILLFNKSSFRLDFRIKQEELDFYVEELLNKKISNMFPGEDINSDMFQKKFLEEKKSILCSKKRAFTSCGILLEIAVLLNLTPSLYDLFTLGFSSVSGSLVVAYLIWLGGPLLESACMWWGIKNINNEIQQMGEAVPTISGNTLNNSEKSVGNSKDRAIKYSYNHGQALNREERESYDYQKIKTGQGYTKKRTITGVKSFK